MFSVQAPTVTRNSPADVTNAASVTVVATTPSLLRRIFTGLACLIMLPGVAIVWLGARVASNCQLAEQCSRSLTLCAFPWTPLKPMSKKPSGGTAELPKPTPPNFAHDPGKGNPPADEKPKAESKAKPEPAPIPPPKPSQVPTPKPEPIPPPMPEPKPKTVPNPKPVPTPTPPSIKVEAEEQVEPMDENTRLLNEATTLTYSRYDEVEKMTVFTDQAGREVMVKGRLIILDCPNLTKFTFCRCSSATHVTLQECPKLSCCNISDCDKLRGIALPTHLEKKSLTVMRCPSVKELWIGKQKVPVMAVMQDNTNVPLCNATKLTFLRAQQVQTKFSPKSRYVFSDQNGNEIEVNEFTDILNARKLTELNMSGANISLSAMSNLVQYCQSIENFDFSNCTISGSTGYAPLLIARKQNLKTLDISGSNLAGVIIGNCPNLQDVRTAGAKLENFRLIRCPELANLDFSQNSELRCIAVVNCARLGSVTPSQQGDNLRIVNISHCPNLVTPIDLTHCRPGVTVINDMERPAAITVIPPFAREQIAAQVFIRGVVGGDFDHFNPYPDDIILNELHDRESPCGGRPKALLPFMIGCHPCVVRVDTWAEQIDTAPAADVYSRFRIASDIEKHPNAYFAEVTPKYGITSCPNLQNTANFFQAFARQIGDGPGLIVDLHDDNGGGEYLERADLDQLGISDVQRIGDTITLPDANLMDARGNPVKRTITIETRRALVRGKPFFHVRVKGLPDNHTFPTGTQQQINAAIDGIPGAADVTFTVSHCNGGMGRGPTQMYMDAIERVARRAHGEGRGCVCDWDQQKLPEVGGKINLAYVARNMLLAGHHARNVCGQSTGQFLQIKQFTEDMARAYDMP